jgi:hypothetical protein
MASRQRRAGWSIAAAGALAAAVTALIMSAGRAQEADLPADPVTPPVRLMTVYTVTNPQAVDLTVEHVISDASGFQHRFWSQVPAGGTVDYHLRDMPEVPSPFDGSVTLAAELPFTATIAGGDPPEPAPAAPVDGNRRLPRGAGGTAGAPPAP